MSHPSINSPNSKVITFYSYKGGTGRSMALANVAWILASNGHTVLAIDWDLEAPGLHRYFAPFLEDPNLTETDGLIDQLYRYQSATSRPMTEGSEDTGTDWIGEYADVQRYTEPLTWQFPDSGRIDLLGPGKQNQRYGERVNLFDWQAFYERYGGGAFFETMLDRARTDYDYILIDSRTGVSDTSGICTVHLPDSLAVFYTLNNQSIEGASAVAKDALDKRRALDGNYSFRVFPIATRIEFAEQDKLQKRRKLAREAFEPIIDYIVDYSELDEYFGKMEILYVPYYAYEEILATVVDQPGARNSLLESFESLTSQLTGGEVTRLAQVSETRREEAKSSYTTIFPSEAVKAATESTPRYDVYVSFQNRDEDMAEALIRRLQSFCKVFNPTSSIHVGEKYEDTMSQAMERSRLVLAFVSGDMGNNQLHEIQYALKLGKPLVPLWLPPGFAKYGEKVPKELASRAGLEMGSLQDIDHIEQSVMQVLGLAPVSGKPRVSEPTLSKHTASRSFLSTWFGRAAISAIVLLILFAIVTTIQEISPDPHQLSTTLASRAVQARDTDPVLSLLLAREAVAANANDFAVTTLRGSLRASPEIRRFTGRGAPFVSASLHPDSNYVIATDVIGDTFVFPATDRSTGAALIGRTREVAWGAVDRGGRPSVFAVLLDGTVTRWSPLDGNQDIFKLPDAGASDIAFGPRGERLLQVNTHGILSVWDLRTSEQIHKSKGVVGLPVEPWSKDGTCFVVANDGNRYTVHFANGDDRYAVSPKYDTSASVDVLLNHDGSRLLLVAGEATAVHGEGDTKLLKDVLETRNSGERRNRDAIRSLEPTSASWSSAVENYELPIEDDAIAFGFANGSIAVWLLMNKGPTSVLEFAGISQSDESAAITMVDFDSTGIGVTPPVRLRFLAAIERSFRVHLISDNKFRGSNRSVQSFDTSGMLTYIGHTGAINDIEWGGRYIVSASQDRTVRVWDPNTASINLELPAEELLRLAESRLPRSFTKEETQTFGIEYRPAPEPQMLEVIPEKGLQQTAE